jgi:segregation and condensation protein B
MSNHPESDDTMAGADDDAAPEGVDVDADAAAGDEAVAVVDADVEGDDAPEAVAAVVGEDVGEDVPEAVAAVAVDGDDVADEAVAAGRPFEVEEWVFGAIEALCFVSADPISPARVKEVLTAELPLLEGKADMAPPTTADVKAIFVELLERWSDPTRLVGQGFRMVEIDGGLTYRTAATQARFVRRMQMGKPQKLSRAALETLAVVAYRQPVTKPQIEEVRGVDCSGSLKALLDKKLVRILGKAEDVGRPLLYGTSKTFLDFFNLQSLNDLPTLKQLQELDGTGPVVVEGDDNGPAMVMDLFDKDGPGLISDETETESADALDALERALGEAKKVAKTASTLVFGIEVQEEEPKPTND